MLRLYFSSKLDRDFYIVSIARTFSKKTEILIRSIQQLSSEGALDLYKSTVRPCIEQSCYVSAGTPSATWICRISYRNGYVELLILLLLIFFLTLAACSVQLAQVFFYKYYCGRYSCELGELFPLSYCGESSTRYFDRLFDLYATKMSRSTVSFIAHSGTHCLQNAFL